MGRGRRSEDKRTTDVTGSDSVAGSSDRQAGPNTSAPGGLRVVEAVDTWPLSGHTHTLSYQRAHFRPHLSDVPTERLSHLEWSGVHVSY